MTKTQMEMLSPGDVVRHIHVDSVLGSHTWLVAANYGDRVTLIETCDLTNPKEWDVIRAASRDVTVLVD